MCRTKGGDLHEGQEATNKASRIVVRRRYLRTYAWLGCFLLMWHHESARSLAVRLSGLTLPRVSATRVSCVLQAEREHHHEYEMVAQTLVASQQTTKGRCQRRPDALAQGNKTTANISTRHFYSRIQPPVGGPHSTQLVR